MSGQIEGSDINTIRNNKKGGGGDTKYKEGRQKRKKKASLRPNRQKYHNRE